MKDHFKTILISQQTWCDVCCPAASLTIASGKVYYHDITEYIWTALVCSRINICIQCFVGQIRIKDPWNEKMEMIIT